MKSLKSLFNSELPETHVIFAMIYTLIAALVQVIGVALALGAGVAVMFAPSKIESLLTNVGSPLAHWANMGQSGDWAIAYSLGLLNAHPLVVAGLSAHLVFTASLAFALPYMVAAYGFFSKAACQPSN